MNRINWYPGHMAKTRKQLQEQLKCVDLILELCDARLPYSSRNPDLIHLSEGRKRILVINKTDLADPAITKMWQSFFLKQEENVYLCNATQMKAGEATQIIGNAVRERIEKAAAKGMRKTIRVMVAGVPNVGKSTYINRLYGGNIAVTGNRPGVTRSTQWVKVGPWLELMDTPGLLWPRLDDQIAARRLCYIGTVKDEILDTCELAISLLEDIQKCKPEALRVRFHVDDSTLKGEELLEAVCKGRGFLQKGGLSDFSRCAATVLEEYRSGKLGRITLELPPDKGEEECG